MRKLIFSMAAVSLAIPAITVLPASSAQARRHSSHVRSYHGCRYSSGTAGLVAGGVGGALIGNSVIGHGALGPIAGAVGGAFAGRAIDRGLTAHRRCR